MEKPWEGVDLMLKDEGLYLKVIPMTELGQKVAAGRETIAPEEKQEFLRQARRVRATVDEF